MVSPDDGGLVELAGDGAGQREHLGQLVKTRSSPSRVGSAPRRGTSPLRSSRILEGALNWTRYERGVINGRGFSPSVNGALRRQLFAHPPGKITDRE